MLQGKGRGRRMPEWVAPLLFVAVYLILMKWVLPRLGVPT